MRTGSGPAPFDVVLSDGTVLSAERRGSPGALPVVLLHAGVADRRSWAGVLDLLQDDGLDLVAVDRRGYGASPDPEPDRPFTHLADLLEVLDAVEAGPALLVGNSMGGGLAIDAAPTEPRRVAALLLIGSAVSGMTDEGEAIEWTPDPATAALLQAIDAAERAGDVEEQVRLQLHLWLDGPTSPEGRVEEPARTLAAAMNRRIVAGGAGERGDSGVDAWHRLGDVGAPGLTVWGDLDVPADRPFLQLAADRLPTLESRVLPGVAHLPSLEQPRLVADLVREAAAAAGWRGLAR